MNTDLVVAGISLAGFIIVVVQALKVSGLRDERWLGWAPWLTALVFLLLKVLETLYPVASVAISGVLTAVVGAASAVLGYFYALKPAAQSLFGQKVTTAELENGK